MLCHSVCDRFIERRCSELKIEYSGQLAHAVMDQYVKSMRLVRHKAYKNLFIFFLNHPKVAKWDRDGQLIEPPQFLTTWNRTGDISPNVMLSLCSYLKVLEDPPKKKKGSCIIL